MEPHSEHHTPPWNVPVLWLAVLAAPIAWFIQLTAGYGLVEFACRRQTLVPLLTATVICAFLALLGGVLSLPLWRRRVPSHDIVDQAANHSQAFFGEVGIGFALLFLLLIAGQTLAAAFLLPCP